MLTCPSCRVAIPPVSTCPFCGAAVFPSESVDAWLDWLSYGHFMQRRIDRERERLRHTGKSTSGRVKEVWSESPRGYYNVTYSFVPAQSETPVERTETVYLNDLRRLAVGDRVDVLYDPLAPQYSALSDPAPAGANLGLSPEQERAVADLDADEAWLEAYRALPLEQQSRQRQEFERRLLDHAERLLTAFSLAGSDRDGHMLWTVRQTKHLLASGVSFSEAAAMALDEMEKRFPSAKRGQL